MQYQPRFGTVEAKRATLEDGGKVLIIMAGNAPQAIVDPEVFDVFYAPVDSAPADAPAPVRTKIKVKPAPKASAPVKPTPQAAAQPSDSISYRVFELIKKGPPRTSKELFDFLIAKDPLVRIEHVYSATNYYKTRGEVETRPDPADGQRRWHAR